MKSGVLNVHHRTVTRDRSYWVYDDGNHELADSKLYGLEIQIKQLNLPWIVLKDSQYETIISEELGEKDSFSLLDDCII